MYSTLPRQAMFMKISTNVFFFIFPLLLKQIKPEKKLPVIVHIHGGTRNKKSFKYLCNFKIVGYFHMVGVSIFGTKYFMDHEVIVVNIPYRYFYKDLGHVMP
jgi:hypothetical protein